MGISINQVELNYCNFFDEWVNDGNNPQTAGGIDDGTTGDGAVTPKKGNGTVEFHDSDADNTGPFPHTLGIALSSLNEFTAFSIREWEAGVWFLNPKFGSAGAGTLELLAESDSAVRIRLFSATNWADFDQSQWRLADGKWQGGWIYLRASGEAGTESRNSGTWTNTDADNVVAIGVTIETQNYNGEKEALEYQVDYCKRYQKIIVTGYQDEPTNTIPWTLADVYAQDLAVDDGLGEPEEWGVVNNLENFFKFFCGLEIGDGVITTEFEASNEFIYLDHSSREVPYDITIKNNATLTLGVRNAQPQQVYAQDGVQIVATENGKYQLTTPGKVGPSFTVENGGVLKIYAGLLQGFGTVNLGSNGTGEIEKLFSDFYDCDFIEFRSTDMTVEECRYHTESSDKQNLGAFYSVPTSLNRITVFNCEDGLLFNISYNGANFVKEYVSLGGTKFDFGIQEGQIVDFVDSSYDSKRIKRAP